MTTKVGDLLQTKGCEVVTIDHAATVLEAITTMVEHKVGSVLVLDRGVTCGIFTERDYMRRIALRGRRSHTTTVQDVMTVELFMVGLDDSLAHCISTMTQRRCRHLPVKVGSELAGVISMGDCVAYFCDELSAENSALYDYIGGHWLA